MPLISVILPLYNRPDDLRRAVNSILAQSFTDFELILSDDGSEAETAGICDEYALKDSRVKVIHSPNGGVSNARNAGLLIAAGEYTEFVDSDDYLSSDMLETMYNAILDGDNELVVCGFTEVSNRENKVYGEREVSHPTCSLNSRQAIFDAAVPLLKDTLINSPCNKLFKTSIIRDNNIIFDRSISLGEDLLFCLTYMSCIQKMKFLSYNGYYYVLADDNSLTSKYRPDKLETMTAVYENIKNILLNGKNSNSENDRYINFIYIKWIYSCFISLSHTDCPMTGKQKLGYIKKTVAGQEVCNAAMQASTNGRVNRLLISAVRKKQVRLIAFLSRSIYFAKNQAAGFYKKLRSVVK